MIDLSRFEKMSHCGPGPLSYTPYFAPTGDFALQSSPGVDILASPGTPILVQGTSADTDLQSSPGTSIDASPGTPIKVS